MARVGISIIMVLVFFVGFLVLQFFLSRSESRWPGLILPAITFLFSLLSIFSVAIFEGMTVGDVVSTMLIAFIVYNIPTVILLGIYATCRSKRKKKKERQIDKMSIQDL